MILQVGDQRGPLAGARRARVHEHDQGSRPRLDEIRAVRLIICHGSVDRYRARVVRRTARHRGFSSMDDDATAAPARVGQATK